MSTVFTPFKDHDPLEVLGNIKHLDTQALLSQLNEPVLLRLAMMTTKQLCSLHGVGPATAKRIQDKLSYHLFVALRRDGQTPAEWLMRNFDMRIHQLSIHLLYQINVSWSAYANINEESVKYAVVHILAALDKADMTMGELADYDIGELDEHVLHYFVENNYEAGAYSGFVQALVWFSTVLREWGVSSRVEQTDADPRVGASDLALAK